MTPPKLSIHLARYVACAAMFLLIAFQALPVKADSTDGSTPLALQPGVPAGSYALSELDHINPYNGSLNFSLPLLSMGGRGTAGYTMTLPIEQKWRVNVTPIHLLVFEDGGTGPLPEPHTTYFYFPTANWWSGIKPGYGPGVLQGRVAQFDAQVCPDSTMRAAVTLTRLTFTAADGTEFELRDTKSGGAPQGVGICDANGYNREKIFVTADGSAATFISDTNIVDEIIVPNGGNDLFYPSGYLLLRDGTRYRFDNGTATWLRDRNGNKISFTYDSFKRVTVIKDSLNREVTITYATTTVLYDEIVYKGYGGASRTLRVNYAQLGDPGSLRSGYSTQTYPQLFPNSGSSLTGTYNPKIVRSVTLPNSKQYQFQYNSYGELARVVLPTGGAFEYDHASGVAGDPGGQTGGFSEYSLNVYRRVTTKRVYSDGTTLESKMTFSNTESVPCTGCVVIDQFGSDGATRISQRRLFFEGNPVLSFYLGPTEYSPWKDGKEYQSEIFAANGSTILQRVARTWQQPVGGASWPLVQAETNAAAKTNNPEVTQIVTTLEPTQANKVSKQTFAYDKYTNQTDVYEYDFGTGSAGSLVRRSHTDFRTSSYDTLNPSAASPDLSQTSHIRNLPAQVSIFDAGGVERARSVTEYDNYTLDGADCLHSFHCGLVARANISGLDASFGTSYTKRGNPTASTRYLLSAGAVTGSISSYLQYDVAGNVVRVLDPRSTLSNNIATTIEYDDRYGTPNNEARSNAVPAELTGFTSFAFPTKVINALGHTSYAQFDYYLGKPVNAEDANGVIASGSFNDSLDRPNQIRRAIGTTAENQTTFVYDDTLRLVTTSSDRDAADDNLLVSKIEYDQMGRTTAKRQYEGGTNYIVTQTQYDALGRPYKNSNPFRPWNGESAVWTTQQFDALGRVITVTTPDNAVVTSSFSGNAITVTDQAGKARKSVTDALGRLLEIYEDPAGLNYQTSYMYDVLDSLVKVTQGSQQRFFMYDSLKRLIRARNPEQGTLASLNLTDPLTGNGVWSMSYEYDNGSNLKFKTDARGIRTENIYDSLNRVTTSLYRINGQPDPNTGDIEYLYDNVTNGKGRLWLTYRWGAKPSHTAVGSYDAMGRMKQLYNMFGDGQGGWSAGYEVSRNYNRAGQVKSQTYPSGRTVDYLYDTAGRTTSFTGALGDGVMRTYASSFLYNARSQVTQELFGTQTPLYHKLQYNIRGQLWDVRVSTGSDPGGSSNRGGLQYFYENNLGYGTSGPDNNGNLLFANTYILTDDPNVWAITRQRYDYDTLNRLKWVKEYFISNSQAESQQSLQTYSYDRWGNRVISTAQTWGAGINNNGFEIDTSTNRLYSPGDLALSESQRRIAYDAAGNQVKDTYTGYGSATFDADNRITAIHDQFAGSSTYTYNANAQRVRRRINNQETWQIYGVDGELVAEYAANAAAGMPQKEYGYRAGELLVTAEASLTPAPTSGLIAHWKFDENTGTTTADSSGNGHTGTLTNGPAWTTGQTNAALSFDGVNDQVFNNGIANVTNNFTISFWAQPTTTHQIDSESTSGFSGTSGQRYAIWPHWHNNGHAGTGVSVGTNGVSVYEHADNYMPATLVYSGNLSGWTHVTVVYENKQPKLYINGSLVRTGLSSPMSFVNINPLAIGGEAYGYFSGKLDEIRIYNRSLSAAEVATLPNGSGSSAKVQWLVPDHLGTPRIILDQTGAAANVKRHDYLPFGEELYAGAGGRTTARGYAPGDGVRQQFTSKERDFETGLDYFLARYYSAIQGRFTSPDEFTGGPDELYDFTENAASNPTIYADVASPQSLNKYQYSFNSPLRFVDPDGHTPCCLTDDQARGMVEGSENIGIGVGKSIANIGIGINNLMADFKIGNAKHVEPFAPTNRTQQVTMIVTDDVTLFAGLLGGKAQVGGVAVAEAKTTTAVVSQEANSARTASRTAGAIERTPAAAPYVRPSGATTPAQRASVQGRPCSVCGESAPKMFAGHREALVKEYYRTGTIDKTRMRNVKSIKPECPTCSNREGAEMSRYSKHMRNQIPK